jgi:predicted nucleic acid-binding protein
MSVLVDSSAWIESFRPGGDPEITGAVVGLVENGEAAIAGMIRLEILRGVPQARVEGIARYLSHLHHLTTSENHYDEAARIGISLQKYGRTIPSTDLLIAAVAISYDVPLLHRDRHFEAVAGLGKLKLYRRSLS